MAASTDNDFKVSYAFQTVTIYLFVAILAGRVTTNTQLATGIFIIYQMWGLFWIQILVKSPNIYSIQVPTMLLHDWVQISLPSTDALKIRKDKVVTSISELSGIRGAHMMVALRVMTATINMLILLAIQADLHYRNAVFGVIRSQADLVPIFLLILAVGFFLTGHFELNKIDMIHTNGHFLGVSLIFLGTLAIGFNLRWNLLSLTLICLEFGLCIYWTSYEAKCIKKSDDMALVTRNSKICIGLELFMFYVTNTILVITIYSSGANEGNIFASPWK